MTTPYRILERKRRGDALSAAEIQAVVAGAADGSWADVQLGAFLMAAAIQGLNLEETRALTRAMLESGEQWDLASEVPLVGDKHSTGGVGDKISLVLSPLLAACGIPVAMLTGRGLGHTGGTADKLESIAGIDLALDRARCLRVLDESGMAVGMATGEIAPADRRLYSLRDVSATIDSLPLITASILSKKVATGAAGVVYDVKTGSGAFLTEPALSRGLATLLVQTSQALGQPASALVTDMSQPLGRWVGHAAEVRETLECLAGDGPEDLMEITYALCYELGELLGHPLAAGAVEAAVSSGRGREIFGRWATAQGASPGWESAADLDLAPEEVSLLAPSGGWLSAVETKELGLLLAEAGGGRTRPGDAIDMAVALRCDVALGDRIEEGQELGRLYLRRAEEGVEQRFLSCFEIAAEAVEAPPRIRDRIDASSEGAAPPGAEAAT